MLLQILGQFHEALLQDKPDAAIQSFNLLIKTHHLMKEFNKNQMELNQTELPSLPISYLLNKKFEINYGNLKKATPLYYVVQAACKANQHQLHDDHRKYVKIIKMLLMYKADPEIKVNGQTPSTFATNYLIDSLADTKSDTNQITAFTTIISLLESSASLIGDKKRSFIEYTEQDYYEGSLNSATDNDLEEQTPPASKRPKTQEESDNSSNSPQQNAITPDITNQTGQQQAPISPGISYFQQPPPPLTPTPFTFSPLTFDEMPSFNQSPGCS